MVNEGAFVWLFLDDFGINLLGWLFMCKNGGAVFLAFQPSVA